MLPGSVTKSNGEKPEKGYQQTDPHTEHPITPSGSGAALPGDSVFHTPFTPEDPSDPNETYVPMKTLQPIGRSSKGPLTSLTPNQTDVPKSNHSEESTPRELSRGPATTKDAKEHADHAHKGAVVAKNSPLQIAPAGGRMTFMTLRHRQRALKDVEEGEAKDEAIVTGHVSALADNAHPSRFKAARPHGQNVDSENPLEPAVTRFLNHQRKTHKRHSTCSEMESSQEQSARRKAAAPGRNQPLASDEPVSDGSPSVAINVESGQEQEEDSDMNAMPDSDHIDAQRLTTDHITGETRYLIDPWEQSVVEYLFPSAFDEEIDYSEFFVILVQLGSVLLNVVMVGINVFYNDLDNPNYTIRVLSQIAFITELVIVWLFFFFMIVVAIHGMATGNVGTNLVVDLVDLSNFTMSFSTLQVVTYSGPPRVMRNIAARLKAAYTVCDYMMVAIFVILSVAGFLCATVIVVLKVTQVDFVFKGDLFGWTWMEFIQLFGLVNNLAGLDLSYSTQTITLLQSLHHHYCAPGGPDSPDAASEGLFSKLTSFLGVTKFNRTYEYIESIFDAHFGLRTNLNAVQKAKFTFNFMAFVLRLDTLKLEQLLQMVRSPLVYYSCERVAFKEAMERGDLEGMKAAVERADPLRRGTIELGRQNPNYFRLIYACDNPTLVIDEELHSEVHKEGDKSSVPAIIFS